MELLHDRRFRALIAHSADAFCFVDAAGVVLDASPNLHRTLGYAPEACRGRALLCCVHPEDEGAARSAFAACLADPGRPITITARCQHRDGGWRWVEATGTSWLAEPEIGAVIVNVRDITGEREAATTLLLRAQVLDSMVEGVSISNAEGVILYTNPAEDAMFGYARGELVGQHVSVQNTYPPEENARMVEEVIAQLKAKGAWWGEFANRKKDGTPFTTFARITALAIGDAQYWVCVQEDMTQRRAIEAELQSSQERLALAHQAARLGTFDWNIQTGKVVWSREQEALYGLPPGAFGGDYAAWLASVHPEDRAAAERAVLGAVPAGTALDTAFRIIRPDGGVRWVTAKARVLRDHAGQPLRVIGLNEDITDRKRAEAAQSFVIQASELLAASLEYAATLETIAQLAVPQVANYCLVDLVAPDGQVQRVVSRHVDPAKAATLEALARDYPPVRDGPYGVPRVYRDGESSLAPEIREPHLRAVAADAAHLALLKELAPRSAMMVPLLVRDEVVGVITLGISESDRRYDAADLAMAEALARSVAFAIDNARLYEAERQARAQAERVGEQTARLQRVTAALSQARTAAEVAGVIGEHGLAALGARTCIVARLAAAPGGQEVEVVHSVGFPPGRLDPWMRMPLDPALPIPGVILHGEPLFFEDYAAMAARYPILKGYPPVNHALAMAPLMLNGATLGALYLGFAAPRPFHADDREFVLTLAHQCAQALERARLYDEAQQAREAAEMAVGVRDQFLSIAAHELKTPLTSLLGNVQMLERRGAREQTLAERDQRAVRIVREQAQRLNRMVGTLLDVSRLELGQLRVASEPVDLSALLARVVEEAEASAAAHALVFAGPPEPVVVAGDALRLEQVVQNLLQNAVKYSPDGGEITVRLAGDADAATFQVVDRGIGIPAGDLPHLFERFFRARNAEAQYMSGVGIGLYVVREIVAAHGGTISVASEEGRGSCFTVTLPRAPTPRGNV